MSLELILGPMFAGKSSAILRIVNRHRSINTPILVLSHSSDNRQSEEHQIVNHDGSKIPCLKSATLECQKCTSEFERAQLIIVEEAQFFPDLKKFVLEAVEEANKDVIVVGLDGDADRKPFGQILDLVPQADSLTKLKAFCTDCANGTEALFTQCKKPTQKTGQVLVGGSEMQMPLCRKHFVARSRECGTP